jgi:hypothetical protein
MVLSKDIYADDDGSLPSRDWALRKNIEPSNPQVPTRIRNIPTPVASKEIPAKAVNIPNNDGESPMAAFKKKGVNSGKIIEIIKSYSPLQAIVGILWVGIFAILVFAYSSNTFGKIQKIPTLKESLAMTEKNLAKQKDEQKYLDELSVNSDELELKEMMIKKGFPTDNPKLALETTNIINQLSTKANVVIASYQKIGVEKTADIIKQNTEPYKEYDMGDFSEYAWFTNYSITINGKEAQVLDFIKKVEAVPFLRFQEFSIKRNPVDVQYSGTIRSFFITQ